MAVFHSPSIVTNGLVLCLDAANPKSYNVGIATTTFNDLTGNGNNGGLIGGIGYENKNGGILRFDGVNDYGRVYSFDYESISNNLYSWEIWFKILSYSPNTTPLIFSNISSAGFNDRLQIVSADNYMIWGAKNTLNQTTYARAEFAPTPNEWYHFVGTMDWGNSVKMYINGQLINENYNSIWGTKRTDGSDLYIGKRADGTNANNTHCEISVFKWYAKELNSTEIQQNYNALKFRFIEPPNPYAADGLVLYLDAGNVNSYTGFGTIWTDLSGNENNGTLGIGTSSPTYNSSNGGSLVFDGVNDYVQTSGSVVNIATNWTTNVWFKTTGSTNIGSLVVRGLSGEGVQWRCEIQAGTGKVNFLMRNTGTGDQSVLGPTSTNDNRWHMATYTNTSNLVRIYLDGNLENSATITNLVNISSTNVVLGRLGNSTGPYYYNGSMAQVSMYNRALTSAEIKQNFDNTKGRFGLT